MKCSTYSLGLLVPELDVLHLGLLVVVLLLGSVAAHVDWSNAIARWKARRRQSRWRGFVYKLQNFCDVFSFVVL